MSMVFTVNNNSQPRMTLDANGNLGIGTVPGSSGGPFGNTGTITAPGGVITNMDRVSMKDLDSEVFKMSIEDLINIWVTRYGNEWVDLVDIEVDPFYSLAFKRLRSLGELEQHYLTDRSRFVCRKPE